MGFLDFLKGVGEVFASLARLLPNFPKFVLCFIKLTIVVVLNWLIMIPGVNYVVTILLYCLEYLLTWFAKTGTMIALFIAVGLVAFVDLFVGEKKKGVPTGNTLGTKLKTFVMLFTTCLNDPRAWFTVQRWHLSNSVSSLFGVYPCMSPCFRGYQPMTESGGLLCKRADSGTPEFCSAASITRVAEGMPYRPLPGAALTHQNCSHIEAGLTQNQKNMVDTVCTQPGEYDNDFLRAVCFDRYCAQPTSDDHGPRACADLVPYKSRFRPVTEQLLFIPVIVVAGAQFYYTMVSSVKQREAGAQEASVPEA